MAFLQFLPWCPLDRPYSIGEITLSPFTFDNPDSPTPGVDPNEAQQIRTLLSPYKGIDGQPREKSCVIAYDNRPILADVTESEMETTKELADIACMSGLAKRGMFDLFGPYCNSDCFIWYGQRFSTTNHAAIVVRRRGGATYDLRSMERTTFSIPLHVSAIRDVVLDPSFTSAPVMKRGSQSSDWGRWQNAISCFKQANTDAEAIGQQVEWILMCSAFERLLDAKANADDVATRFSDCLRPRTTIPARDSIRHDKRLKDRGHPLRYEWMREFYRVRGDFAHGRLSTAQPTGWSPLEHLVLASISFPLCMKSLLQANGHYQMTDEDQIQIDAFEAFANQQDFLGEPPDSKGSGDSWWSRHLAAARGVRRRERAVESLKALGHQQGPQ